MLIVETGQGSQTANSYVSVSDFKTWADARGLTYGTDEVVEQQILRAMDFIEAQSFVGLKHTEEQALQWPRDRVIIDNYSIETNEIPKQVKLSVYEAVKIEIDGDSKMTAADRQVTSEKVGDIAITYKDNAGMKRETPALTFALRKIINPMGLVSRA